MSNKTSVPNLLEEVASVSYKAEIGLREEGKIIEGTTKKLRALFDMLPMQLMPEGMIVVHQKYLDELQAAEQTGDDSTDEVKAAPITVRIESEKYRALYNRPRQQKVSIPEQLDPFQSNRSFNYLWSVFRSQCLAIDAATHDYPIGPDLWKSLQNGATTWGHVHCGSDGRVDAYLMKEWQYEAGDKELLLDIGIHPEHPDAGDELISSYIREGVHNVSRVLMPVRESDQQIAQLLQRHEFHKVGESKDHYAHSDDTYEDAHLYERKLKKLNHSKELYTLG